MSNLAKFTKRSWVGETIVDNQGSGDCKPSGNQGWLRSINKNFGHPA
jgi:hypothetical protein